MSGLDAVDDVFVSGNRAVFTLDQGAATDKAPIAAALEAKGMKLESFSSEVRPKVAAAYVMNVEGIT